ncbi:MAG: hypothetical protein Q4C49_01085 [Bacillota bacterium]|nr:hypothetical protein [Bacillota bacterium]
MKEDKFPEAGVVHAAAVYGFGCATTEVPYERAAKGAALMGEIFELPQDVVVNLTIALVAAIPEEGRRSLLSAASQAEIGVAHMH